MCPTQSFLCCYNHPAKRGHRLRGRLFAEIGSHRQGPRGAAVCAGLIFVLAACHTAPAAQEAAPGGTRMQTDAALQRIVFETPGGLARFDVEVAKTPEAQAQGLMFRRELQPNRGMLFVFDSSRPRQFWMKNTYISLDMIFVDAKGMIVGIVDSAEPQSTQDRGPSAACRYVIEVIGGTAQRLGIKTGQHVRLLKPGSGGIS